MTSPGFGLLTSPFGSEAATRAAVRAGPSEGLAADGGTETEFASILLGALGAEQVSETDPRPLLGVFEALAHGGEEGDGGPAENGDASGKGTASTEEADVATDPAASATSSKEGRLGGPAWTPGVSVNPSAPLPDATTASRRTDGTADAASTPRVGPAADAPTARDTLGGGAGADGDAPSTEARAFVDAAGPQLLGPVLGELVTEDSGPEGPEALAVNRDPAELDAELRDRVQRVTERMQKEFGHRVEVVEGLRTPERQARLFEQGRSRSGPIVTWTRESRHIEGRAVDLKVDGTWQDPVAYGRLQKVAREEGLVTLGPRDPGHVELAEPKTPTRTASVDASVRPAPAEGREAGSGMARVARVAAVARPAGLARPARVAVPRSRVRGVGSSTEGPIGPGEGETPTIRTAGVPPSAFMVGDETASLEGEGQSRGGGNTEQRQPRQQPASSALASVDVGRSAAGSDEAPSAPDVGRARPTASEVTALADELIGDVSAWTPAIESSSFAREFAAVTGPSAGMFERLEQIEQMKEAAGLNGPGELRLDLDEREGLGARIRMALRGSSLETRIDMDDPALARRMQARIKELHKALEARGLEPASLDVRAVKATAEGSDVGVALKSAAGVEARKVTPAGSSEGSEPGAQQQHTDGQTDDGRREWREFLDRSGQDHRRERDGE